MQQQLAQAAFPISEKTAGPLQAAQEAAILDDQQPPLELRIMPDGLLLAGLYMRESFFENVGERQQIRPGRRIARAAQPRAQFRDTPA
jgi:hypothetical protein